MSEQTNDWEGIIEQYKLSGLSQLAFCKKHELSYNQFQYRWYLHNRINKEKVRRLDKKICVSDFESVTLSISEQMPHEDTYVSELMIHLPNGINCAVKIDCRTNGFARLLKQLVTVC